MSSGAPLHWYGTDQASAAQHKHKELFTSKPWLRDPHYVKHCYISAIAVLKLIEHAQTGRLRQGGGGGGGGGAAASSRDEWVEVMGQLQGYVADECVVLTDAFGIPVPATAVECSLDDAATNFLVQYSELTEKIGKPSKVFGWYHTHPGYTSFLSGTDVTTQRFQQMMGGPVVALVLDPVRTLANGKIELKAFRTYPEKYNPTPQDLQTREAIERQCAQNKVLGEADPSAGLIGDGVSSINNKKRDVAYFAQSYYEVPITIFRSEKDAELLDKLWGRFWSKTFSVSSHIENKDYMNKELGAIVTHLTNGQFVLPSVLQNTSTSGGGGGGTGVKSGQANTTKTTQNAASENGGAPSAAGGNSNNAFMDNFSNPSMLHRNTNNKGNNTTATTDSYLRNAPSAPLTAYGRTAVGGGTIAARAQRDRDGNIYAVGLAGMGHSASAASARSSSHQTPANRFDDVLPLSRNMGLDAIQALLTGHVKHTLFGTA